MVDVSFKMCFWTFTENLLTQSQESKATRYIEDNDADIWWFNEG